MWSRSQLRWRTPLRACRELGVHGWRGNTSISQRIKYDIYYIENWSLRLDLKILWMTLRGIRHNAY